jgi:hypothetical protein
MLKINERCERTRSAWCPFSNYFIHQEVALLADVLRFVEDALAELVWSLLLWQDMVRFQIRVSLFESRVESMPYVSSEDSDSRRPESRSRDQEIRSSPVVFHLRKSIPHKKNNQYSRQACLKYGSKLC